MKQYHDVQVRQDTLNFVRERQNGFTSPFIALVTNTYSERMTCDLETTDGQVLLNIPVMTQCGLSGGAPYGEVSLPMIDDYVIVIHASYGTRHKVIIGTIFPYLANEFGKDAVNSGGKAFTKKLLEPNNPKEYRRIFPSGTSVQIKDDGSVIMETPSGMHVTIDEAAGNLVIEDSNGNNFTMGASSVTINGNFEVLQ